MQIYTGTAWGRQEPWKHKNGIPSTTKNHPVKKLAEGPEQTFLQKRCIKGRQAREETAQYSSGGKIQTSTVNEMPLHTR